MAMPMKVYLAPLTFGFGPASHAVAIATALRSLEPSVRLVGVADGVAADFLSKAGVLDEVVVEDSPGGLPAGVGTSTGAEALVSVADFERACAARELGVPAIVVDALYWMWDHEPLPPGQVDRYLCLAFPGVEERVARSADAGHVKIVPQILADKEYRRDGNERHGALLNFGGAVAPFGSNPKLLAALVRIVAHALGDDEELLVACSRPAAEALAAEDLPEGQRVEELAFDDMVTALSARRILFTLPGLSIMWEALAAAIPSVVLPAANYSQHRQLASYVPHFEGVSFLTWDDLPGYASLPANLPEADGGQLALALGERFAVDLSAQQALARSLRHVLSASHLDAPSLGPGHPWSSFDGAVHVAKETIEVLADTAVEQ